MKKIFIVLLLILCSTSIYGQKNIYSSKRDSIILKDLWLKNKLWEEVNIYTNSFINQEANLYPNIHIDQEEALKVEILPIPNYALNKKVLKYVYGKDFNSIITWNNLRVSGFISYKGEIIGYMNGYYKNGRWNVQPVSIFKLQSSFKLYSISIPSKNIRDLFEIGQIKAICYRQNDSIYAFDQFFEKFLPIEDYVKERVHLEALRNYFLRSKKDNINEMD